MGRSARLRIQLVGSKCGRPHSTHLRCRASLENISSKQFPQRLSTVYHLSLDELVTAKAGNLLSTGIWRWKDFKSLVSARLLRFFGQDDKGAKGSGSTGIPGGGTGAFNLYVAHYWHSSHNNDSMRMG